MFVVGNGRVLSLLAVYQLARRKAKISRMYLSHSADVLGLFFRHIHLGGYINALIRDECCTMIHMSGWLPVRGDVTEQWLST